MTFKSDFKHFLNILKEERKEFGLLSYSASTGTSEEENEYAI